MGTFASTPTFELFKRGLEPRVVKKFRGINVYRSRTTLGPEWAQDCLNVLVPGSGGLSKFRLPVALSAVVGGINSGPNQFFDFQQGNGTRQVVASFGANNSLYYYTWNAAGTALNAGTLIELAANDGLPWSFVESNNILFAANGQRMMKWTGANWWNWGIVAPNLPTANITLAGTVQRAANVVTFAFAPASVGFLPAVNDLITVTCPTDATYNGTFIVATVSTAGNGSFTYAQNGANSGPLAASEVQVSYSNAQTVQANGAVRFNGVVTLTFAAAHNFAVTNFPTYLKITGATDASFNGTFLVTVTSPTTITYFQGGLIDATTSNAVAQYPLISNNGWMWVISFGNSKTGHQSNASIIGSPLPSGAAGKAFRITGSASNDPQVDSAYLWRTVDGGGDFFLNLSIVGTLGPGVAPVFVDTTPDAALDKTQRAPFINNVPLTGKYLAVGQSRVFVANLPGAPQDIIYSGYEQILVGRPEESFPPSNRLRLSIGAEAVTGIGILHSGVVAFSATKRMYMLRGSVEDITLAAPVQFSAFLEELPWNIGTLCHDSIQTTPYGLLFWATDKTVNVFDGYNQPQDISEPVYPILHRATPGQEVNAKSCYFNWLERDWYGLTFAIDGSLTNNFIIWWALHKDTGEMDIFPCGIQADSMMVLSTPKLQRILAIGSGGKISNLPVSQDTSGGVSDLVTIPATNGVLSAYWRNGYFGNDSPQRAEMWRWLRLVTDQPPNAFLATLRLVDDDLYTVVAPYIIGPQQLPSSKLSINRRAKRCSVEINFPQQDVSSNVLELQVMSVPSSDR